MKEYIRSFLEYTSQGVTLDGVTARLEEMKEDLEAGDMNAKLIARGITITYKLYGKECSCSIGAGVNDKGKWCLIRADPIPTDDSGTDPEVEQAAGHPTGCCPCNSLTVPDPPPQNSRVNEGSSTIISDPAPLSQE